MLTSLGFDEYLQIFRLSCQEQILIRTVIETRLLAASADVWPQDVTASAKF